VRAPWRRPLFAADELSGFVAAVALVKPNKSIFEVDVPSVRKKMKDKAFARAVSRDDIVNGAAQLGVELDAHIAEVIEAMKGGDVLGLAGARHRTTAGTTEQQGNEKEKGMADLPGRVAIVTAAARHRAACGTPSSSCPGAG
jgi:hypothetical protein